MNTKRIATGWLLTLITLTACALGQTGIYVEYYHENNPEDGWAAVSGFPNRHADPPESGLPSGSDVSIGNANNVTYRVFATSPSTTDIGDISINASSNSVQPRLLVGRFVFLTEPIVSQRLDAAGARDVKSISSNTGKVRVQAWVKRDILSGGVDTHEIVRIDVDGDILGPISHRPVSDSPTLGMLRVAGNIAPTSGGIVAFDGDIGTLDITGGNLSCDVLAENGDIRWVSVAGTIGTLNDPVNIWCNGHLRYLECQDLYADVDTGRYGTTYPLYELYVESTDPNRGNFEGRIHCLYVSKIGHEGEGEILVTGNLMGDIDIDDDLAEDLTIGGVLNAAEPLTIGAQLKANDGVPVVIHFDNPLGLEGQIIINAINTGEQWNGTVEFAQQSGGPVALSPSPYYDNPSSTFGGGAVGLVPYHCHLPDCTPAGVKDDDDSDGIDDLEECEEGYHARVVIPVNENNLDTVTVMHYGPIVQEGTGKPFTVRRKSLASPMCEWIDRTSDFTHTMHPGGNARHEDRWPVRLRL